MGVVLGKVVNKALAGICGAMGWYPEVMGLFNGESVMKGGGDGGGRQMLIFSAKTVFGGELEGLSCFCGD